MPPIPNIMLTAPGNAESVLIVRHALGGVAEALDIDVPGRNDLFTAVTEACNNVVTHAYGDRVGPMRVEVLGHGERLSVVVRDKGQGLGGLTTSSGVGIGLQLIKAISEEAALQDVPEGGTEVRMSFAIPDDPGLDPQPEGDPVWLHPNDADDRQVKIAIFDSALARPVLPRALAALAASASFSTDMLSDVERLGASLAAQMTDDRLSLSVRPSLRRLELSLDPFPLDTDSERSLRNAGGSLLVERLPDPQTTTFPGTGGLQLSVRQPES
jgi:serine/threonine-protein kinase RsbW